MRLLLRGDFDTEETWHVRLRVEVKLKVEGRMGNLARPEPARDREDLGARRRS
jgi:hypothetical protein